MTHPYNPELMCHFTFTGEVGELIVKETWRDILQFKENDKVAPETHKPEPHKL